MVRPPSSAVRAGLHEGEVVPERRHPELGELLCRGLHEGVPHTRAGAVPEHVEGPRVLGSHEDC